MAVKLSSHQLVAIDKLGSGFILCGGVGSGKSRTAIAYYVLKECKGKVKINGNGDYAPMKEPKDLYIITTAKKRDSLEWEHELAPFVLSTEQSTNVGKVKVVIDSWNNLHKYSHIKHAFFIFDEQRVVGSGAWVKAFQKIAKSNRWILLTATPGDTWQDYIPVFVANGFYKNRTEFLRLHAVYSRFTKYPKIDRYLMVSKLIRLRDSITVIMPYVKKTVAHDRTIIVPYDKEAFDIVNNKRWNIFADRPVKQIGELCYLLRRVANQHPARIDAVKDIFQKHPRLIIFYNFDYELEMLRNFAIDLQVPYGEWNGHNHQEIPGAKKWLYLVQYAAGAEGWNCIKTDAIVFFSQSYSYKTMTQAAGRIDRLNTPYTDLYYYHLKSMSLIDIEIAKALRSKKDFNLRAFMSKLEPSQQKHGL